MGKVTPECADGALITLALQEQTVACSIHIDVFGFCGSGGFACHFHARLAAPFAVTRTGRKPTEAVRRYCQAHLRLRYRQWLGLHFHELAYAVLDETNHAVGAGGFRHRHALSM